MSKSSANEPVLEQTALFPGLVDIVLDDNGRTCFLMDDGETAPQRKQGNDEPTLVPPRRDKLKWNVPHISPVKLYYDRLCQGHESPQHLFEVVRKRLAKHSSLPTDDYYDLLTAWVFHTYRQDWLRFSPIIFLFGVAERGKSRTGEALAHLSYRGKVQVSTNEAPLFRLASLAQPTFFLDVERFNKQVEKKNLGEILLARAERGRNIDRCTDPAEVGWDGLKSFDIFGPTVVATNEKPRSAPLLSRGLFIVMPATITHYPPVDPYMLLPFREWLTAWRWWTMTRGQKLKADVPGHKWGRWRDITQPLRQITTMVAPDRLPNVDRALEDQYGARQEEKSETVAAYIIRAVIELVSADELMREGRGRLTTEQIKERFSTLIGWERVGAQIVGEHLRSLRFERTKMDGGNRRGWTFTTELLEELKNEYDLSDDGRGADARTDA